MSQWFFNIFVDGVWGKTRMMFGRRKVQMVKSGVVWLLTILVFEDDIVLMAECGGSENNDYVMTEERAETECSKE